MFPKKEVQLTVVGKVFKPNRKKVLALNRCLEEYFKLVSWYLNFNSTSKTFLHKNGYEKAKQLFNLNTALIQTARDKAVEILKSFNEKKKEGKVKPKPKLKRISIRFDKRCYSFANTTNKLTPYWLTLSLNRKERVTLPVVFGERQKKFIEEALQGKWQFCTVEVVKRNGEWYAHFVLKKEVEFDEPETVIGVDLGEWNVATAVAISKQSKPMKGQFWSGAGIREIRGKYSHIRRNLQRKKRLDLVKQIGHKEERIVNQQLHVIANEIVAYAKQFEKPVIAIEELNGIRENMNSSAKLNRRLHAWGFRKLQQYIEYKANLEGIPVVYVNPKDTSKRCHRCGHVAQANGREFRCPKCGLRYNRDLNAAINIAHALMRGMGWGSCEPPELPDEVLTQSQDRTGEAPCVSVG
ncbi:RNA-guided endonuclease InsQ/TnpB family protein [Archaeoglobus veneficus]|uniref:Transposase, IS605 OrfB family n=1 Tax=Archaeoglobus veneficus (strain DSM 11195 / SNP6) TaxID=693661 RepID=F2KPT5_ARCVS|nr:RNA-guided endonuclease TnpB family protein [Archaeoglobus veneficus]AEA46442.1 transposase, IS605 OrfB family [Archaeoglobus veneficus SNP6]